MRSTADRGRDFARGIWIVDPLFLLDAVRGRLQPDGGDEPAREESYLAGARLHDTDLRAGAADDREQRAAARQRRAEARPATSGSATTSAPPSPTRPPNSWTPGDRPPATSSPCSSAM